MTTPEGTPGLSNKALRNLDVIREGFQRGETQEEIQDRIREETGSGIRQIDLGAALIFLRTGVISEGFNRQETERETRARFQSDTGQEISTRQLRQIREFLTGKESSPVPQTDQRFTSRIDKRSGQEKAPDPTRARLSSGPILRAFSYTTGIVDKRTGEVIGHVQVTSNTKRSISNILRQARASVNAAGIETYAGEELGDIDSDDLEFQVQESIQASETIL